jgi:hypothetical protein
MASLTASGNSETEMGLPLRMGLHVGVCAHPTNSKAAMPTVKHLIILLFVPSKQSYLTTGQLRNIFQPNWTGKYFRLNRNTET